MSKVWILLFPYFWLITSICRGEERERENDKILKDLRNYQKIRKCSLKRLKGVGKVRRWKNVEKYSGEWSKAKWNCCKEEESKRRVKRHC